MIDEAIRRATRYALGICLGLTAIVYLLDPATMADLPRAARAGPSEGGWGAPARGGAAPEAAAPQAEPRAPRKPLRVRAPSGVVLVAFAPAPLGAALQAAAKEFRSRHGGSGVLFNLGTTPEHCQALASGRYADLVVGAGEDSLASLVAAGRIPTARSLARIPLALAVPGANPGKVQLLADLAAPGRTLAIAAPSTSVGVLTRQALEKLPQAIRSAVLANVVAQFDDPSQVLTRLGLGSVDAGFVLRSDLSGQFGQRLEEVDLPPENRPAIPIQAAVLPSSDRLPFAEAFLAFLESSAGSRVLVGFGIEPPPSS